MRERNFPPGAGWVTFLVAMGAVIIISLVAITPRFQSQTVGTVAAGNGSGSGDNTSATTDTSGGTAGTNGHTVTSGGSAGSAGSAGQAGGTGCAPGRNGGHTAPGVSATEIHVASTIVTSGIGSGFLGEASYGMQAAINEVNRSGGICGRRITLETRNDGWVPDQGQQYIENYVNSGDVFALVGEPDSEGLDAAINSNVIDNAGIPVVGSDGMLKSQYHSPWVWPVAASTVTNMHIAAQYAVNVLHSHKLGIVYDSAYKFGKEGAAAFAAEAQRLGVHMGSDCSSGFCGISSDASSYTTEISAFDGYCNSCDTVMMLLEPSPMETWMHGEEGSQPWYGHLMGGEPLFDNRFASTCGGDCNKLIVWTGYRPAIQPFDSQPAVYTYVQSLQAVCGSCDAKNEFTEGAYLGARLFVEAVKKAGGNLTRDSLKQVLNTQTWDLGLSQALAFNNPHHLANTTMTAFIDNAQGSFNGWAYLNLGYLADPALGQDID